MDFASILTDWRLWAGLISVVVIKYFVDNVLGASKAPPKKIYNQVEAEKEKISSLKDYTAAEVASHNSSRDIWIIVKDKIYDVTNFLPEHPGSEASLLRWAGKDCTTAFFGDQHPDTTEAQLKRYIVGNLVKKN